jgi:hypothetical protein
LSVDTPFTFNFPNTLRFYESNLPESKFNKVVFPEPDGPRMAVNVLGSNLPEAFLRIFFYSFFFSTLPS